MKRALRAVLWTLILTAPLAAFALQPGGPPVDLEKIRQKPIATDGGKVGALLKQWWKDGTASGNAGDFYDNRDGDHSPLDVARYPQLSAIKYSPADIKLMKHWAAARIVLPHVTFGNSSTSAPAHLGGSNPRSYYVSPNGMAILYAQYTKNNLYIYPEHRDHDPGHNGISFPDPANRGVPEEGYGDLYPTNTPYLIISQGSSGSDQPFMRMLPHVLAAFRPEVKRKLSETGTLMPTIQMLLRSTNKHLKDPREYLSGKAHPSVFEGSWVDELAMVQIAHALELTALPPMVQLRVIEEDKAINGIDYFERGKSEVFINTPACIARVHRTRAQKLRLVVDAGASFDVNKAKLTYHWVVLRGDPARIKITPKKDDQSSAEISVAWHERRPVSPGSPLESNRVDIGVFVHNGTHYSAPGFVTVCTLDREARDYNGDGKILSIAHGLGETEIRVPDWERVFAHLAASNETAALLQVSAEQRAQYKVLAEAHNTLSSHIAKAQAAVKRAEAAVRAAKEAPEKAAAQKALDSTQNVLRKAQKNLSDFLARKDTTLGDSPRGLVEARLAKLTHDPLFTLKHQAWLKQSRPRAREARVKALWQKLVRFGVGNAKETLLPLLPGKMLEDAKWTPYERSQLEWLHASLLAELAFPGMLDVIWRENYVDFRLSAPRPWRDVYRYDAKGECTGWIRYGGDQEQLFNHEGLLVVEKDRHWRCLKGRTVRYELDPTKKGVTFPPLRMVPGDTIVRYEYDGPNDTRGRRVGTEKANAPKK